MRFRRFWAVARKEFLHVLRDPRSLGMGIAIPMTMLVLFGYALTLDVDRVPLVVWDQSRTSASRDLVSRFTGSRYFALLHHVDNYRALEEDVNTGRAMAALVIPVRFARELAEGLETPVQLIVDGSDSNTATIAIGYAEAVTFGFTKDTVISQFRRIRGQRLQLPLDARGRVWFNPDLQSKNYIIPGLIAVIMMIVAALLTSLTIAREWERGTMEQLISTPVKGSELVLGKLVPYFTIGMVDVLLAVLMGEFLFEVPLRGSVVLLFGMTTIFLIGVLALGILISIVTKSQLVASQLALILTFLPAYLLSGFMFAISNMPGPVQVVTYLIPARYFVSLLKGIYLKGVGLEVLYPQAILLSAFSAAMLGLALVKFKKKLA